MKVFNVKYYFTTCMKKYLASSMHTFQLVFYQSSLSYPLRLGTRERHVPCHILFKSPFLCHFLGYFHKI